MILPVPVHCLGDTAAASGRTRGIKLDRTAELEQFFIETERRAFRIAEIATGSREDALDILQDAMYKLVEKYSDRNREEWGALFHTILQSRIKDWYRRNSVRNRFRSWFGSSAGEDDDYDPIQTAPDPAGRSPERLAEAGQGMEALEGAIRTLPLRQQQAFILRVFEGLDVAATATAMSCSEGSVKTHYSRAVHALRDQLGEYV
ncbi:MAG: RNA polymerase sigma factor [Thiotrichales bacterium]|nr:RNA polymerase sigma factor [Thiotrichales bacterium]